MERKMMMQIIGLRCRIASERETEEPVQARAIAPKWDN